MAASSEAVFTGSIADWDMWATRDPSAAFHHNSYYGGHAAGDFTVILARGGKFNGSPEGPLPATVSTTLAASAVVRNRSLNYKHQ